MANLTSSQVEGKLLTILYAQDFDILPSLYDTELKNLGMDSLEFIEFVIAVERMFNMLIDAETAAGLHTFNDWVEFVQNRIRA